MISYFWGGFPKLFIARNRHFRHYYCLPSSGLIEAQFFVLFNSKNRKKIPFVLWGLKRCLTFFTVYNNTEKTCILYKRLSLLQQVNIFSRKYLKRGKMWDITVLHTIALKLAILSMCGPSCVNLCTIAF